MNKIEQVLRRVSLDDVLQTSFDRTRRIVLTCDSEESIVLFQWKQDQYLPDHSHVGDCHYQVLRGCLLETRNGKPIIVHENSYGYIGKDEIHSILPLRDSVSIHCYRPPPTFRCPSMDHVTHIV